MIVAVEVDPAATDDGESDMLLSVDGFTVNGAVTDTLPTLAVIVAVADEDTGHEVTGNVACVSPSGTVISIGAVAASGALEDRFTVRPSSGAGPFKNTVPVACCPPVTEVGKMLKLVGLGGTIVKVPFTDVCPELAVIVTDVAEDTGDVCPVNVTIVWPAGTVTLASGVALEELEERLTTRPPVGAGPFKDTMSKSGSPPTTGDGRTNSSGTGGLIVRVAVTDVLP